MSSVYVNPATGTIRTVHAKRQRNPRLPGWSTPERREQLVALWEKWSPVSLEKYFQLETDFIEAWIAEDRDTRQALWELEEERIHHADGYRFGGDFDPVQRDEFMRQRPSYYLEGIGVSSVTMRQTAKIRVPSTNIYLFVDVSAATNKLGKNARKRLKRQGREIPADVHEICQRAIKSWWAR